MGMRSRLAGVVGASLALVACGGDDPPLEFTAEGNTLRLAGVVDERALDAFDKAVAAAPEATTLVFEFVPGSIDDDSNIALARRVRESGFATQIPADGLVASGGTDLFLAGATRTIATGACVGVHTWGDDQNVIGSEVPEEDPVHQFYLDYYADMGVEPEFYWFTLDAAGIDESHWMSRAELDEFKLVEDGEDQTTAVSQAVRDFRCENRLEDGFDEYFGD